MRLPVGRCHWRIRRDAAPSGAVIPVCAVLLMVLTGNAVGQSSGGPGFSNPVFVRPDLGKVAEGESPLNQFLFLNGKPDKIPVSEWPFTVRAALPGGTYCTATMIGPRVLLTAAHCISKLSRGPIPINLLNRGGTATCRYHPRFQLQGFAFQFDYALCLVDSPLPELLKGAPKEPKFESLSLNAQDSSFRFGNQSSRYFVLLGYGCTTRDQKAAKEGLSGGYTRVDLFTPLRMRSGVRGSRDNAILCAGDSGGAVYRLADLKNPYGPRTIVAVNSANIVQGGRLGDYSFLAKTSAPAFVTFFRQWKRDMGNPKVCGIDRDIDALCRKWR